MDKEYIARLEAAIIELQKLIDAENIKSPEIVSVPQIAIWRNKIKKYQEAIKLENNPPKPKPSFKRSAVSQGVCKRCDTYCYGDCSAHY